jgi:ABC-type Zn2+ transport system substrate-binding protein/surface adhesin
MGKFFYCATTVAMGTNFNKGTILPSAREITPEKKSYKYLISESSQIAR